MKAHEWLLLFHDDFQCLENLYAAGECSSQYKEN